MRITSRQTEVLTHLASGLSNKEIADKVGISGETVRFHVRAAVVRLQAINRTHAVAIAIRSGLI